MKAVSRELHIHSISRGRLLTPYLYLFTFSFLSPCFLQVCIKSADISHPARETGLHLRWTRDIIQEFFLQARTGLSL